MCDVEEIEGSSSSCFVTPTIIVCDDTKSFGGQPGELVCESTIANVV